MNQQRSKDCYHKIVAFQLHKGCSQSAAICQRKCQDLHSTNFQSCTIPIDIIQEHFSQIKMRLIQVLKVFTVKFTKEYEQVIKMFQKKFTQNSKEMEKQMLATLIKATNMNKDILDKIENQRFQKLKCYEIFEYLDGKNDFQERLKNAALQQIYEKHLNNLKIHHKNFDWKIKTPQGLTPPNASKNFIDLEGQTTNPLTQKYQTLIKQLNQKNENLRKMLKKFSLVKRQNLKLKTWDILKVKTKKIVKQAKQKAHEQIINDQPEKAQQPNNAEVAEKKPSLNEFNNFDSEEISDFIEKKKTTQ